MLDITQKCLFLFLTHPILTLYYGIFGSPAKLVMLIRFFCDVRLVTLLSHPIKFCDKSGPGRSGSGHHFPHLTQDLLIFIYTGRLPNGTGAFSDLVKLGQKLSVKGLPSWTERQLTRDPDLVVDTIQRQGMTLHNFIS